MVATKPRGYKPRILSIAHICKGFLYSLNPFFAAIGKLNQNEWADAKSKPVIFLSLIHISNKSYSVSSLYRSVGAPKEHLAMSPIVYRPMPVSYTHLDVYKRQQGILCFAN